MQLACVWATDDADGFAGDSELHGRVGNGPWRPLSTDAWNYLIDGEDGDPLTATFLDDEPAGLTLDHGHRQGDGAQQLRHAPPDEGRAEYTGNSFKSWDDIHDDHKSIPEDGTKVVTANVQGIGMWASLPGNRRDPRRAGARRGSLNR